MLESQYHVYVCFQLLLLELLEESVIKLVVINKLREIIYRKLEMM